MSQKGTLHKRGNRWYLVYRDERGKQKQEPDLSKQEAPFFKHFNLLRAGPVFNSGTR